MNNSIILCKYCQKPEDKIKAVGLTCSKCEKFVHTTCLKRQSTPGGIYQDVFFTFICLECNSLKNEEVFERDKMKWFQVIMLTLFDLAHNYQRTGRQGYFHWKAHIVAYIDRHWHLLFPKEFKRKKNWTGTVSGALSSYSPHFFQSGSEVFKEGGWWRPTLRHLSPEIMLLLHVDFVQIKLQYKKDDSLSKQSDVAVLNQIMKKHNLSLNEGCTSTESEDIIIKEEPFEMDQTNFQTEYENTEIKIEQLLPIDNEDIDSNLYNDSENIELSEFTDFDTEFLKIEDQHDPEVIESTRPSNKKWIVLPSLFNKDTVAANAKPWETLQNNLFSKNENFLLSVYEENEIITKLSNGQLTPSLQRLLAKLKLRKLKRAHNRAPFNIDVLYKNLISNPKLVTKQDKKHSYLDRYQMNNFLLSQKRTSQDVTLSFSSRLRGETDVEIKPILSPYTNRILKPYIRRDFESKPIWLRLLSELKSKAKTRNLESDYVNEDENAPLDYCYVRPEHIPAINALCEIFFWPGIDMSEALQHPDFSCVVLYKKLIVAFAFLIPDVAYNESYISFIFTRPEWRRAGIATFMLYHLVQTCMGKEVTLHVSATNPAVILYQKFGFKIEEFVQDFYDKYMPSESKYCKHALFLRLAR